MLKSYLKYGAVTTKVRAMSGKLLSKADWAQIAGFKTLNELAAFLRNTPAWGQRMAKLSGELTGRALQQSLRAGLKDEYTRLYRFGDHTDKRLLGYAVFRAEYRAILSALARLGGGGPASDLGAREEPLAERSKTGVALIELSADFEELLQNTARTVYGETLRRLPRVKNGMPDFAEASEVLENRYYSAVYADLEEVGAKVSKGAMDRIGLEADLLNICGILRLHRNFPASLPEVKNLLIPIRGQLTEILQNSLIAAPDEASALALLQGTAWAKFFPRDKELNLERLSEQAMETFCRDLIKSVQPGPFFPQAFLTLREIECAKLSRVITAISYGINPATVL
ncbi:MAG: V-type ATPase subunit [Firmicutes bacterium]|nr:V-type ATPase subunit [Bacillota bacterium]